MMSKFYVATLLCLASTAMAQTPVGLTLTTARSVDGNFISWKEHIIDDPTSAGFALSGSDGLVVGDIDKDGFVDIVSVHESDSEYDSSEFDPDFIPDGDGHVRIAFGSADPERWLNITLAEGADAPAPEDVAVGDVNGDGYLDVMVAAELSHLIYLQNPAANIRNTAWPRLILPMTREQGSYIRVFLADLNGDGRLEATAPNKGAQRPGPEDFARSTPVSIFTFTGDPLAGETWQEIVLGRYSVPQNAEPADIDNDGDMDLIVGTRGEQRLALFENLGTGNLADRFQEHAIGINGARAAGFNLEYADLDSDGRLDIISATERGLSWLEQPELIDDAWNAHFIGSFAPDTVTGLEIADINGDGLTDVFVGSYSGGSRIGEDDVDENDELGRLGWFENPGASQSPWIRHDVSRRKRGMFDKFIARDMDRDGDIDFIGTRGNSAPYDGVFWLEQVRTTAATANFQPARSDESEEMALPNP